MKQDEVGVSGVNDAAAGVFQVLDESMVAKTCDLGDPKITGTQVAGAVGFSNADEVIVLLQLKTGALAEIRPDELVDLRGEGIERFFVIVSDRTFRFLMNGVKMEWPKARISGETLRKLAGKDDGFEVILELETEADRVLDDDDVVDLSGAGTEHFKTKAAQKKVTVFYGEAPFELTRGVYSTEQLLAAFSVEPGYVLDLITEDGQFIELKPGGKLKLKHGMHFASHPPCGQSS